MALSQFATRAGSDVEKDETYKKIVDKRNVPDIGRGALYFRILGFEDADFFHGMEFWLNVGHKKDGSPMTLPRISPNPFTDFVSHNSRTGGVYVSWKSAKDKCPLSKLTFEGHPLIVKTSFRGGEPKPNVSAFHAARIQLIEPERDAKGQVVKDKNGFAQFTVLPDERILKMTQNWWDQLVRLVEGEETQQVDDGFADATPNTKKEFPTKDLTKVIFMIRKEKRTKNPNPDPALNVDYVLDFSAKIALDKVPALPEAPIDFGRVFKPLTQEELKDFLKKHNPEGSEDDHRDPSKYGETLDEVTSAPSNTDDPGF